ncbi:MAG: helix-turn-helix domain-containing protein [Chitinophagaceae bacterium]
MEVILDHKDQLRILVNELDTDACFKSFGDALGAVLKNNTLHFSTEREEGFISKRNLEEGLIFRFWNLKLLKKDILKKLPNIGNDKNFYIIYLLIPEIFLLKTKQQKVRIDSFRNVVFFSNLAEIDFETVTNYPFQVIEISITGSWLLKQFKDADAKLKKMLQQLLSNDAATVLVESTGVKEYKVLHEIQTAVMEGRDDSLFLRGRLLQVIALFFNKILNRDLTDHADAHIRYNQIMQVEAMLMAHLKKDLPNLEVIARRTSLSISTMMRHFKHMYGKSIYEYYLDKKMELAKRLLLENPVSVNEASKMLGYEKASHFVEVFSKHHGFSPGKIRSM